MEKKGKPVLEFQSPEWLQDLAFIVDITDHLNNLNRMLESCKKSCYSIFKVYMCSSCVREIHLSDGDLAHFPCLKDVVVTADNVDMNRYKDSIKGLLREFQQRFQIFDKLETDFTDFHSPFTANGSDLPVNIQLEMIDLQCDSGLKNKFTSVGLVTFYQMRPGSGRRTTAIPSTWRSWMLC
ncbi:general transcription factor II-I repeat domain-containing protein 2B-like [Octopus bimaculoides]|uniref:general transcription factor II-I repeat domain-containing protein 2B-like n=1 Tax=Octopus bimaculoides TaxID=37653 RepID=UPI00071D000B|nr:general transcription factor II-I repeat domain-containing protein 2B-like [Octopus bimaculoides]|eukprot:XP_014787391.1 PREDICTED: general transcription factor II-I repeat domain-containing protein 2B-like [Octopus bimaculoides]